jgi:hypothetical protein
MPSQLTYADTNLRCSFSFDKRLLSCNWVPLYLREFKIEFSFIHSTKKIVNVRLGEILVDVRLGEILVDVRLRQLAQQDVTYFLNN